MSDNVEAVVEPVETVEEVEDSGNLPSAKEETSSSLDKFAIDAEFQEKHFKNGKLYGRFDSLEAVLNTLHSVETKYSNVMREIKTPAAEAPAVMSIQEAAEPIMQKFRENDFDYTGMDAEIAEIAEKTGKSVAEIKLMAIETKESVQKAYAHVGGKEEYNSMVEWGRENLSEAQRSSFDNDLNSGLGEYAIKGLYQAYKESAGEGTPAKPRIEGSSTSGVGARGYSSFSEMTRDRAYIQGKGRMDTSAINMHNKRMSLTPDNVIYGR